MGRALVRMRGLPIVLLIAAARAYRLDAAFCRTLPSRCALRLTMAAADHELESAIASLPFDNSAMRTLVVDPVEDGAVRTVRGAHLVRVTPQPLKNPSLVAASDSALALLDLETNFDGEGLSEATKAEGAVMARFMSGNELPSGAQPTAACYCGHQFGSFAGQLGDGAAISLGEIVNGGGSRWEMQLKGSGLTPFSRMADGRKVLRSSIREFLASEAMHHLGVPTTRAAALVSSDSRVMRDALYNGESRMERCAVVCRLAEGFLRFGSFELCWREPDAPEGGQAGGGQPGGGQPGGGQTEGPSAGLEDEVLLPLLEYAIARHYPEIAAAHTKMAPRTAAFLGAIVERTARLVAKWQAVGFVHGVLNTDNMAITGETLDFGPFGFMDLYDPDYVPNSSDAAGRYSYAAQPSICCWNLERFALCLRPALGEESAEASANEALAAFWPTFEAERKELFRAKLGLFVLEEKGDEELLSSLLQLMQFSGADFTNCFRGLSRVEPPAAPTPEACYKAPQEFDAVCEYMLAQCATVEILLTHLRPSFHPDALIRLKGIMENSPEQLGSFGLNEAVVRRELRRAERREKLQNTSPRDKRIADAEAWRKWLYNYRMRLARERQAAVEAADEGQTAAAAAEAAIEERVRRMNLANPRFVLRQHIAAGAIERAEANDYSEVRSVLRLLQTPYEEQGFSMAEKYASVPPDWSHQLTLT